MEFCNVLGSCVGVALRKESVDRNQLVIAKYLSFMLSLSARRAWIEMSRRCVKRFQAAVALRKESVDRNRYGHCG